MLEYLIVKYFKVLSKYCFLEIFVWFCLITVFCIWFQICYCNVFSAGIQITEQVHCVWFYFFSNCFFKNDRFRYTILWTLYSKALFVVLRIYYSTKFSLNFSTPSRLEVIFRHCISVFDFYKNSSKTIIFHWFNPILLGLNWFYKLRQEV